MIAPETMRSAAMINERTRIRTPPTDAWLSMTQEALRCMLRRNQVPAGVIVRIGRRIRFKPAALRAWIEGKAA